eukprot:CAMPEP_0185427760 /NCGR_PEP_ID=MMETSP1365-20130426/15659_1 /TAXON_ID=38817 /ORGANISM="Gephyrocapsa oceanica, Strain RCC1303" /LENGTH=89 /DNA_ID=CAMNT_0028031911 /DNA_START=59 /DNA_END=324 /DNA_ORIENTATION=-
MLLLPLCAAALSAGHARWEAVGSRLWDGRPVRSPAQLIGARDLSKRYWSSLLAHAPRPPVVIDATCGNGHDSESLALAVLETSPSATGR